jgi:hypothetical protein
MLLIYVIILLVIALLETISRRVIFFLNQQSEFDSNYMVIRRIWFLRLGVSPDPLVLRKRVPLC